ncbi:hypothetical protein CSB45_02550 [candidate division KSB3 bacterium]|uniref:Murein biosynthesis integral membrane protein MurJ n=1 Tax=candidate division KSB3 bacterium TaxID=2044937 RepID=A0A2G6E9Y6_9BACT|nr:MAG: hypothetical protein CSB45_02550 [candidate division KSB3 bacterium]PIE30960.1 MAG: hypothetical protein CSA57_01165 [candidate division KSB3 bacterium]
MMMEKASFLQNVQRIQKAGLVLAAGTLLANSASFVKSLLIARYYGTSAWLDAYFISLTPMLLITGILVSALHATLIPHVIKISKERGEAYAFSVFITFSLGTLLLVLVLTAFLGIGSRAVASLLGKGFTAAQQEFTSSLLSISTILVILTLLNEIALCVFHIHKHFALPSLLPFLNGVLSLIYLMYFHEQGVIALMWGLVLGLLLQTIVMLTLAFTRLFPRNTALLAWSNADLKRGVFLMLPLLIGASFGHINLVIDQMMASTLAPGSIAALNYASRLHSLVNQLFIMVLSTAVLPFFAKQAADNDMQGLRHTFLLTLKRIWWILLPLSVSILLGGRSAIQVIFQRGEFSEISTLSTSGAWIAYSLGLPFQATGILTARVYNALQKNTILMYVSALSVGFNIFCNWCFMKLWGHIGIAAATSVVYALTTAILLSLLYKKLSAPVSQQ